MGTQREKVIIEGEDRLSQPTKKAETAFGKFQANLGKWATVGGIAIASKKLLEFGRVTIGLAVDAEEAAAAFNTTFGPAAAKAGQFVEDFANKAGFTRAELQQLLAVTGNIAIGLGATEQEAQKLSQSMATVSGDIASFSNIAGGAPQVLAAMQSAINGETEALKSAGIAITATEVAELALQQTRKESAEDLTRLERATATVALVYQKAGKAVGDLDRTQDSSANTMRRISSLWREQQIVIGQGLLPTLEKLFPIVEELIPVVGEGLGSALELVATVIEGLVPLIPTIISAFEALTGVISVLTGIVSNIAKPFAEMADALGLNIDALDEIVDGTKEAASAFDELDNILKGVTAAGTAAAHVGTTLGFQSKFAAAAASQQAHAQDQLMLATWRLDEANVTNLRRGSALVSQSQKTKDALRAQFRATDKAAQAELDHARATENLTDKLDRAMRTQQNLTNVLLAAASPVFAAVNSFSRYQDELAKSDEMAADASTTTEELARQQLEVAAAALAAQAGLDQLDPTSLNNALESIAFALGIDRQAVEDLLTELGLLDGKKVTTIIDVQITGAGSRLVSEGLFNKELLRHAGGIIPQSPGGGDVNVRAEPGEFMVPRTGLGSVAGLESLAPFLLSRADAGSHALTQRAAAPDMTPIRLEIPIMLGRKEIARAIVPDVTKEILRRIGGYH